MFSEYDNNKKDDDGLFWYEYALLACATVALTIFIATALYSSIS